MDNLNVLPEAMSSMIKAEPVRAEPIKTSEKNSPSTISDATFEQKAVDQAFKADEEATVTKTLTQPELEQVVNEMNNVMATVQRDINFSVDEKSGRNVISVYEKGSDTLIRQLPSKEALKLLDNLEQLKGLLFKADV